MKLLIIDTETAGENCICEIAATLYNVGGFARETGAIASFSTLLPVRENSFERVNAITHELTQCTKVWLTDKILNCLRCLALESDYLVAFNAEFDAPLVNGLLKLVPDRPEHPPRLCAMKDFDWGYPNPNKHGGYKLTDLALWLGVGVSTVHRAGDDVRLLVECFNRRRSDLPEMLEMAIVRSKSPMIELQALVSYDYRHLAKSVGFIWEDKPGRRGWYKQIRGCDAENFICGCSFEVVK